MSGSNLYMFAPIFSLARQGVQRKEDAMTDAHQSTAEQNARRIAGWLVENRMEFEGHGVGEDQLAAALGMTGAEVTAAVDHLENREEVVRVPQALTTPPQFVLKAGRGWPEMRDEILGGRPGG